MKKKNAPVKVVTISSIAVLALAGISTVSILSLAKNPIGAVPSGVQNAGLDTASAKAAVREDIPEAPVVLEVAGTQETVEYEVADNVYNGMYNVAQVYSMNEVAEAADELVVVSSVVESVPSPEAVPVIATIQTVETAEETALAAKDQSEEQKEEPVVELAVVDSAPIFAAPIEEPAAQVAAVEAPVVEETAEPVEVQPVAEVVEAPVEAEPVAEVVKAPVEAEPVAEVVEAPVEVEPVVEAVVEEPVYVEPVVEEVVEEPVYVEPVVEEVVEEPVYVEPVVEEPAYVEPVTEAVVEEPVYVEPVTEAVEEPVYVEPVEEEVSTAVDVSGDPASTTASGLRQQIVDFANSRVGVTPYVWAGTSLETGTDCSGFVSLVYNNFGLYASAGSDDYQNVEGDWGENISYSELQPGDVVVYRDGGHVGIYAGQDENGNDLVIHDSNEIDGVKVSDMNYSAPTAFVRVSGMDSADTTVDTSGISITDVSSNYTVEEDNADEWYNGNTDDTESTNDVAAEDYSNTNDYSDNSYTNEYTDNSYNDYGYNDMSYVDNSQNDYNDFNSDNGDYGYWN